MSTQITYNGFTYYIPASGDQAWGDSLSAYLIALSNGSLNRSGGIFQITSDVNFGSTNGIISEYFGTRNALSTSIIASVGGEFTAPNRLRLGVIPNASEASAIFDAIAWRNNENTSDLRLIPSPSSETLLNYNGTDLVNTSSPQTLTNKSMDGNNNTFTNLPGSAVSGVVLTNGTAPLTANWSAGSFSATFNAVDVGSIANTVSGLATIINSGTLTLPTSSDTLVGRNTADTFSNKIFTDSTTAFGNVSDTTKEFAVSLGSASTATKTTFSFSQTANRTISFPNATDTVTLLTAVQTLTNKTLTAPTISGGAISGLTALAIRDTSAAFDVTLAATSSVALTAGKTLTIDTVNTNSTLKLAANLSVLGTSSINGTVTGSNTGDQTITLSGDVSGTGTGAITTAIGAGKVTNTQIASAAGISVNKLAALTASTAVATDASGFLVSSSTTAAELSFVHGVTSSIQTQINAVSSPTITSKSASYAILDNDGFGTILVTTSTSVITITLPAPATNTNRILRIKKVDSGTGTVLLTHHASETIDGASSKTIASQYEAITVQCDGTNWDILDRQGLVTNFVTFTPTFTGSITNPTVIGTTGSFRRNGDSIEITVDVAFSVSSFGAGYYQLILPSSLTIDTTKITLSTGFTDTPLSNSVTGLGTVVGNGALFNNQGILASCGTAAMFAVSTTQIVWAYNSQSSAADIGITRLNGYGSNDAAASNNQAHLVIKVPVTQYAL